MHMMTTEGRKSPKAGQSVTLVTVAVDMLKSVCVVVKENHERWTVLSKYDTVSRISTA